MAPTNNADNFTNPISVNTGGTGISSTTAYAPIIGGTTSTAPLQQATTNLSTSGSFLTSGGAGAVPTWTSNQALVLLETLTASSSASLTFTSTYITSAYTTYMVTFNNIIPSGAAPSFNMTWSTNNGSSYLATGYQSGALYNNYNSATFGITSATTFCYFTGLASGFYCSAYFFINLPQSGIASYRGRIMNKNGFYADLFGNNSTTSFVNNIQFAMSSGNILSGTVSLYGIKQ